jgi:hypothetical protein
MNEPYSCRIPIDMDKYPIAYEMSILKYNGGNYLLVPKVKGDTP